MDDKSIAAEVARLDGRIERLKAVCKQILELVKQLEARIESLE